MKSIQKLLGIILIIIVCSCGKDEINNSLDDQNINHDTSQITTRSNQNPPFNTPIYSQSKLIVQYAPGVDDGIKDSLRSYYDVVFYDVCELCPDKIIEIWDFGGDIQIEPKRHAIETCCIEIVAVDYEFELIIEVDGIEVGSWEDTSYEPLIVSENTGITIAILDTGFDPFFPMWYDEDELPIPMLYNASETAEGEEVSGWDFIDSDPNPFDDNLSKHGSILSYEFLSILDGAGVPFQILPAKVFDQYGKTSYSKLVCSAYYVLQRADIVQMSFGWYNDNDDFGDVEYSIFKNLLEMYNDVIVVTSAGNNGADNDDNPHYPSSFEADNIIAVAATNAASTLAAPWSNYGESSVDFWAAGMNVPFYKYDGAPIPGGVQGTSFAAPQIAAQAAIHQYFGGGALSPSEVTEMINMYGTLTPWEIFKKVKYDKLYPMMVE